MKPVKLSAQQREDILSIRNDLALALMADGNKGSDLVPTALENAYQKMQDLIADTCVDGEESGSH